MSLVILKKEHNRLWFFAKWIRRKLATHMLPPLAGVKLRIHSLFSMMSASYYSLTNVVFLGDSKTMFEYRNGSLSNLNNTSSRSMCFSVLVGLLHTWVSWNYFVNITLNCLPILECFPVVFPICQHFWEDWDCFSSAILNNHPVLVWISDTLCWAVQIPTCLHFCTDTMDCFLLLIMS